MSWLVLYTKPKNEKKVTEQLLKIGIEAYCPMVSEIKQWSDRKKKVTMPLMTSYVFVNIAEQHKNEVFQVNGVVRYLFWLGKPAKVRDIEISHLKEYVNDTVSSVEITNLKPGDTVSIKEGPFKGKEGVVQQMSKNKLQLVLRELGMLITLVKKA